MTKIPELRFGNLNREPAALRFALIVLAFGTLMTGILPQFWLELASRASMVGGKMG